MLLETVALLKPEAQHGNYVVSNSAYQECCGL